MGRQGKCERCYQGWDVERLELRIHIVTPCGHSIAEVFNPQLRHSIDGISCPNCHRQDLWWFCKNHFGILLAACPSCFCVFAPDIEPQPCPDKDRHSCCNAYLADWEGGWLGVMCAHDETNICVCHDCEAESCSSFI